MNTMRQKHFTFSRRWCSVFCTVLLLSMVSKARDIDWSKIGYAEAKQMFGLTD